jgi:hypothetical protein
LLSCTTSARRAASSSTEILPMSVGSSTVKNFRFFSAASSANSQASTGQRRSCSMTGVGRVPWPGAPSSAAAAPAPLSWPRMACTVPTR